MTSSHEQASLAKHVYKPTDTPISSPTPVPVRDSFVRDLVAGGMSGIIAKTIGKDYILQLYARTLCMVRLLVNTSFSFVH